MKYLPCIGDDVLTADERRKCYDLELAATTLAANELYRSIGELHLAQLAIIDKLSAAYIEVSSERDHFKGICNLAGDKDFWNALAIMKTVNANGEEAKTESTA